MKNAAEEGSFTSFSEQWSEWFTSPGAAIKHFQDFYKSRQHKDFAQFMRRNFSNGNNADDLKPVRILLGVLHAVREVAHDPDCIPLTHALILGVKLWREKKSITKIPLSIENKRIVKDCLRSYFEVFYAVEEGERFWGCVDNAKAYLKCITHLFECLPELKLLTSSQLIQRMTAKLNHCKMYSSVARIMLMFPESFDGKSLECLLIPMIGDLPPCDSSGVDGAHTTLETVFDLLVRFDEQIPTANEASSDFWSNCKASDDDVSDSMNVPHDAISISRAENDLKVYLRDLAVFLVQKYQNSEKKSELTSMRNVCKHFCLAVELKNKVTHNLRVLSIRTLTKSKKWQIAEQMASNVHLRKCLYQVLLDESLYVQANEVYQRYKLHGQVAPVPLEKINEQIDKEKSLYLQLPQEVMSQVVIVNCMSSLNTVVAEILEKANPGAPMFIGVDAEWRAVLGPKQVPSQAGASILQVAVAPTRVFIFDLKSLGGKNSPTELVKKTAEVLKGIFAREDIVKVGWGFNRNDVGMLRSSCGGQFHESFASVRSVLNLPMMHASHIEHKNQSYPSNPTIKAAISASECCKYYFGQPLHKAEQVSNWDARPLTPSQIQYASLDALCMLAILDRIAIDMNYEHCKTGASRIFGIDCSSVSSVNDTVSAAEENDGWRAFI